MKNLFILFFLAILPLLLEAKNPKTIQSMDRSLIYCGKVVCKNGTNLQLDLFKSNGTSILFPGRKNSSTDSIAINDINLIRVKTGAYTLEGAGLGLVLGSLIVLRINSDTYTNVKPEAIALTIGGFTVIGMIIGAFTSVHDTYMNQDFLSSKYPDLIIEHTDFADVFKIKFKFNL